MAQQVSQNTFIRGLQMDTSPMQLDSATLSNALNATLVTMNGNEVILLNDMGNARVDNAYLPSGYVPIGMKEYGGVIYVAAYNPITNKGQVGSFPSPERRFGAEYPALISGDISIDNFFSGDPGINKKFTFEGEGGETDITNIESFIKTNTILVPLIKNYFNNTTNTNIENLNIIRAGDKFSIYDSDGYILGKPGDKGIKQYLSNFDNVVDGNALYLKNNIITFSVGVLNSQNEFVDITPSLKRFKNNKIIEKESNIDAFNTGYFITSSKPEGGSDPDDTTSDDKKLIEERNKYAVNTYGQKLVGPLYLKMQLNVIEDFEYAIYGNKNINNGETTYDIFIVSYYKYNFPDGVFTKNKDSKNLLNQGYKNNCLEKETSSGNNNAYIYKKYGPFTYSKIEWEQTKEQTEEQTGEGTKSESKNLLEISPDIDNIQYNTTSNLYSASSTLEILGQSFGDASTIEYTLLPGLTFGGMKELKATGILDLTKLGTGIFEINNWRYYNADGQFTLTYGWESYPKYGERISNVKFEFVDIYKSELSANWDPQLVEYTYSLEERDSYNGLFTNTFILEDCNLNSNTLYLVRITADVLGATSTSPKVEYRFILTTELFNDCYFIGSESFIKDYGKPKNNGGAIFPNYDNEEEVYSGEALTYHNKLKINFDFDINYEDYGSSSEELYGNLASKSGENIEYGYVKKYNINLKLNYNLHIVNPDYYPTVILEIEPLTTGAEFLPKELVPSSSEAPLRPGEDFDSTEGPNSTTNTSTGKKLYFIDPTLDYSGGTIISSGGTGSSGNATTYYEYIEQETDQENLLNEDEQEGNNKSLYIYLELDNSIENILKKIGYREGTTNWDDFTLEELTKPNITFDPVTGNIYGSLNIYDKCIAQTKLYPGISITNPFRSIYDHLETIFSMYNGRLFGYILQSSNKSKNIAAVSNVDVTKNNYYFPNDFPSGSDRTGNGQRRPEAFKPNGTADDRSYLMTFNSAKDSDSDLYEKISGVKNSNRNTVLNMSIKKRVLTVQEKWANNNPKPYSIVGMLNADYLNKATENWSEELAAKSNLSLFCWIWWKTTDPLVFALFPVMWFNDKIGVGHTEDPDAGKSPSELAEKGQRYKYNTTLSESIGDYNGDNIFKNYLQEFVFTFGGIELFDLYLTDEGNYTKVKTLYNAILQILASIKIDTPDIEDFYNTISTNLSGIYSANLFKFWKEDEIKKDLEKDYSIKFPSSNKVDELLQESREISNGNADGIDVSGGRVYDAYGRHLDANSIYLADENGALKANRDLANYFDIDTEKKTISIESSKINYLPLSRVCRYMSWQSRTGELENNVKSDAINCFPRMNVEGSVFKTLDDDTNKHWVKV